MTAGCIPDKILIKDDTYCAIFVSASPKLGPVYMKVGDPR